MAVVLRMAVAFRAHAAMLESSRHEAVTDALTGLGNRRRLMHDLEASMEAEEGSADTLALFDLDGFKRYNDAFGHPAGDALLQRLAGNLERAVQAHGRAYAWAATSSASCSTPAMRIAMRWWQRRRPR